MKKRRNGKYTSTSRSSKTDAFKIEFVLLENKFITGGFKNVYIEVVRDSIVNSKEEINFNDTVTVKYENNQLAVVSFINVNRNNIHKGSYHVNIFIDDVFIQKKNVELK
ncbi:hypothetical protein [Tenacibaculum aestuariivivum]|uniref:hypothetical protein n=1 Tax=Tenacibaculum aestuariivivum TaxID=2006131 RepID=UPI003AB8F682